MLKRPTCLTKAVTCGLLNGMVKLLEWWDSFRMKTTNQE